MWTHFKFTGLYLAVAFSFASSAAAGSHFSFWFNYMDDLSLGTKAFITGSHWSKWFASDSHSESLQIYPSRIFSGTDNINGFATIISTRSCISLKLIILDRLVMRCFSSRYIRNFYQEQQYFYFIMKAFPPSVVNKTQYLVFYEHWVPLYTCLIHPLLTLWCFSRFPKISNRNLLCR